MPEQIEPTFKAQRRTINLGDISLEVAMLPDSTYRLSYAQATEAVEKDRSSMLRFCQSKYLKTLLGEDFQCCSREDEVFIEGAPRAITPVTFDVACLYWQRCATQGNVKARALVVALLKRSLYELADEAFGVERSGVERSSQLKEDLSSEGQARIEAIRQTLEWQVNTQPETATERELKLLIRVRELELELERLKRKVQRTCLLPDKDGKNTIPGIIGSAVLEDVKQILNTSDDEVAIESIYRLGFNPQNDAWCRVKIEKLLMAMPESKYYQLLHLVRSKRASVQ